MKEVLEALRKRFEEVADKLHVDETGDEELEQLHASYERVIDDLEKDKTDEWIAQLDEDSYTVRVLFSDNEMLYYVSSGLMAMSLGWMTVDKLEEGSEELQEFIDHPMKSGVAFDDDAYYRGVLDFRFWSIKTRSNIEKDLPLTDPLVRDYVDACIGAGWRPEPRDNLKDEQNKAIVQLDHMIRKTYGGKKDDIQDEAKS